MRVRNRVAESKGATAILVAIAAVVLLGFAALTIDIGFALVVRNQLHNVADAAALAGTRELGRIYEGLSFPDQENYVLSAADRVTIINRVIEMGQKNRAGGKAILINTTDITIGDWDMQTRSLTPTDVTPDAVRVTSRRDGAANGPISTFLARILGINTLSVTAQATAALTGIGKVVEGKLDLPVGISETRFREGDPYCGEEIRFYPTNDDIGCAGWNTFFDWPASTPRLENILDGMLDGTYTSPEAEVSDSFEFIGGNVAASLPELQALYDASAVCSTTDVKCSDAACDGTCEWKTFVAVYRSSDCGNPTGTIEIVGFATVIITEVQIPPEGQLIRGRIECGVYEQARGGGAEYGTKGSIPGLVQ